MRQHAPDRQSPRRCSCRGRDRRRRRAIVIVAGAPHQHSRTRARRLPSTQATDRSSDGLEMENRTDQVAAAASWRYRCPSRDRSGISTSPPGNTRRGMRAPKFSCAHSSQHRYPSWPAERVRAFSCCIERAATARCQEERARTIAPRFSCASGRWCRAMCLLPHWQYIAMHSDSALPHRLRARSRSTPAPRSAWSRSALARSATLVTAARERASALRS